MFIKLWFIVIEQHKRNLPKFRVTKGTSVRLERCIRQAQIVFWCAGKGGAASYRLKCSTHANQQQHSWRVAWGFRFSMFSVKLSCSCERLRFFFPPSHTIPVFDEEAKVKGPISGVVV